MSDSLHEQNALYHHGVKGQKWGVRRTPAQLGHKPTTQKTISSKNIYKLRNAKKGIAKAADRIGSKIKKKFPLLMSDDELRKVINRMNMEEQYANLVSRKKDRNKGAIRQRFEQMTNKLVSGGIDRATNKALDALFKENDFNVKKWFDKDVKDMDADTIQKVSNWYENAQKIIKNRKTIEEDAKSSASESPINGVTDEKKT